MLSESERNVKIMNLNLLDNATSAASADQTQNPAQIWMVLGMYALLALAIYFFIFRPNKKKKKAEEEMKNSLEVGDEITTIGGIMGRVISIKDDDSLVIETASDRSRLKIKRWAISTIDTEKEPKEPKKENPNNNSESEPKKKKFFGKKSDKE